jgi:chemotaxis protein CheY-P-specific phosphatase CheC
MKVTNPSDIITESISMALEKIAFLDAIPAGQDCQSPEEVIVAEIDFSGQTSGRIQIAAEKGFVQHFAENMSGMSDLTEEEYNDALKELANITCGLVLPMISESSEEVFDLTVPHLTKLSPPRWQDFVAEEDTVLLDVEGFPICVKLEITSEKP